MLHYTKLEKLAKEKYSSLLVPFVSYEENEVLWLRLHASIKMFSGGKNASLSRTMQLDICLVGVKNGVLKTNYI